MRACALSVACAVAACTTAPQHRTEVPAVTAVPSAEDRGGAAGWGEGRTWMDQHEDINRSASAGGIELVLLGDSITQSWGGDGRSVGAPAADVRRRSFAPWSVGNFGISGDRTQHLLWRIEHGNFDGIRPRAILLLIGTNNLTAGDPPEEVAAGIAAVVERLLDVEPEAEILLLAILPRGELPTDPLRARVEATNRRIRPLDDLDRVRLVDLGPLFLHADGAARRELYAGDFLHLSLAGYEAWGEAVRPVLDELLGD